MKKYRLPLLMFLSSLLAFSFANTSKNEVEEVKAYEDLSLASNIDAFKLLDKEFAEDESFVYTADLHFRSGQAGGLAFGSKEDEYYYVINMDRFENRVKLLYFASNGEGGYNVKEIENDYFIGNSKITSSELFIVNPSVAGIENVNLKIVLTREDEHAYVEFFVEGIKRFGVDTIIDLNDLETPAYQGGYLGMNCFNADVYITNIEIGKSDYSYFSEPYRNQYHLQPFSKWSNDPNALCYYNGWYHVFYQTHPFGLYWGDMYWGHARSRDLIHFEFLPICLFPETDAMGFGPGNGFMWSGCAITYTYGMSQDIDDMNWFPNGEGNGLLAIYTRAGGLQDQVVISSDDEGLTWTKRVRIPQNITGYNDFIDLRDPKVFPLKSDAITGKVLVWGMTLSSYNLNKGWFLSSNNLLNWSIAGSFALPTPECIGIGILKDDEDQTHAYLTNKSRTYILGTLSYNEGTNKVTFYDETNVDISTYSLEEMNARLKPLDYGPDSYASQSFYITDPNSEFYGKDIVLNWFSGDLNASYCTGPGEYASLRERWNGGFTIPVEYGVKKVNGQYLLSQKPITVDNPNLEKTEIINISNQDINSDSDNLLKDVHTHIFELEASIEVNDNSPIVFRVDVGDNEYMQFGWNETDGYYVDRTYLDDKGIATNVDWHAKYATNILGNSNLKTFYVLSDNGGLEVFCEDYAISFYFVTTASIYSTGAYLKADSAHINTLKLNEVKTIYRKDIAPGEGKLYVSSNDAALDNLLTKAKFITCWFSGNEDLVWEVIENDDVVSYTSSNQGINFVALKEGTASFKVSAGNQEQVINVTVHSSTFTSDLTFESNNVISGQWLMAEDTVIGEMPSGNAFLLAKESGSDFTYTGQFDIISGQAASLVFRASSDMSTFLVANYDANEKVVKLWSKKHGELKRSEHIDVSLTDITLSVKASVKDVQVTINGVLAVSHVLNDDEPLSGQFGLNVFSGSARFKSLSILKENYEYSSGELMIPLAIEQFITSINNVTLGNVKLEPGFYYQSNGALYIKESYFDLLPNNGRYQFRVIGSSYAFTINVDVDIIHTFYIDDMSIESGNNAVIYIGNNVITSVEVNGVTLNEEQYEVKDYTLIIYKENLLEEYNQVTLNDSISFEIEVNNRQSEIIHKVTTIDYTPIILIIAIGGGVVLFSGAALLIFLIKRKKEK